MTPFLGQIEIMKMSFCSEGEREGNERAQVATPS